MHTEYFQTDELDQYSRRENVRIFGIPEDYTVEDDGKKQLLKLAGELSISLQEILYKKKTYNESTGWVKRKDPTQLNLQE